MSISNTMARRSHAFDLLRRYEVTANSVYFRSLAMLDKRQSRRRKLPVPQQLPAENGFVSQSDIGVYPCPSVAGPSADNSEMSVEPTFPLSLSTPPTNHKGMFPCFLRGIVSTLFSSIRSARITRGRVSRGSITSSMNPRSAAMNGFANRSRNSAIFCCRAAAWSGRRAVSRR